MGMTVDDLCKLVAAYKAKTGTNGLRARLFADGSGAITGFDGSASIIYTWRTTKELQDHFEAGRCRACGEISV